MYRTTNPSALRSQKAIMDAFVLLLKDIPYEELCVKQILCESKLTRKTFYRNFKSKDDVLSACITRMVTDYSAELNASGIYTFEQILNISFDFCERSHAFLLLLKRNDLLPYSLQVLNRLIPIEHRAVSGHESDLGAYALAFNIGAIWNAMSLWLERDMQEDKVVIIDFLTNYLHNNIMTDLRRI